jgi:hypothetical protein
MTAKQGIIKALSSDWNSWEDDDDNIKEERHIRCKKLTDQDGGC